MARRVHGPSKREIRESPQFISLVDRLRDKRGECLFAVRRSAIGGGYESYSFRHPGRLAIRASFGIIDRGNLRVDTVSPYASFANRYRIGLPVNRFVRSDPNRTDLMIIHDRLWVDPRAICQPHQVGLMVFSDQGEHFAVRPSFEIAIGEDEVTCLATEIWGTAPVAQHMREKLEKTPAVSLRT